MAGSKGNFVSGGVCVCAYGGGGGGDGGGVFPPSVGYWSNPSVCMLLCLATAPPHLTVSVSAQVCVLNVQQREQLQEKERVQSS